MIREAVSRSLGVVRVHPWVMLALGAALVLAILSTFTGLGFVLAPWFVCEVLALSLGASGITVQVRGLAWLQASLLVLAMGVLFGSVVVLAALVFGPDLAAVDRSAVLPWDQSILRLGGIVAISLAALVYVLPFVHVPTILVERGGPLGSAVLESVLLVRRAGPLHVFRLLLVAAGAALAPAVVAAVVAARTYDRASTPLGLLASAPLLLFSLPLGLVVVAQGYLLTRHMLPPRHLVHRERVSTATSLLLTVGVVMPVVGLVLLLIACALPAPLLRGAVPVEAQLLARHGLSEPRDRASDVRSAVQPAEHLVPGTTLLVSVSPRALTVRPAFDDEAEVLSTPRSQSGASPIATVALYELADVIAVEPCDAQGRPLGFALFTTAGARLDDTVHRALDERMGLWRALVFGPSFVVIALLVYAALEPLARCRHAGRHGGRDGVRHGDERSPHEAQWLAAGHRARRVGWLLVPLWLGVVTLGALAIVGL